MKTQEKISNENGNWYIVEIIEKYEPVIRNEKQDLRRVTTWGNHHLIKADSPEKAFDKAVKLGKEKNYKFINSDQQEMESIFVGIGELLPIYEDIEDGAELMWNDYGFISNRRTMRMPYKKKELMELIKPKQKLTENGK
ncbi:DUF4288 domain-containing protein [Cellulophaga sp. Hel_I_12]|jgi:hypothetical protein|uniref:DUF4288 domain-containing protein n=1 Tax=Cellulophaga sp. Hel_I_12 TaxID=1249972 RepID=UPI0006476960|nr:DUF4288 domain-containing protein [Cellulophaga sp. Hel_I_12]